MNEIAITIPLRSGGGKQVRALALQLQQESRGTTHLQQASLWLHETRTGQERAILYRRWDEQITTHQGHDGWIIDALRPASDLSFRVDDLEAELVYSWDSPTFDGSQSYDTGACSLRLLPHAIEKVEDDARLLQSLATYDSALEEVGFQRIRNWVQRDPEGDSFLTIYNEALDLRAAFHAWPKTAIAIDQWTRNEARALSGEDEELWEDLLSVERILTWGTDTTPP